MGKKEVEQPGLQAPHQQALPRFVPTLPRSYVQAKILAVPSTPLLDAKRRERGEPISSSPSWVPSLDIPGPMLNGMVSPRDDLHNWKKGRSRSPEDDRSRATGQSPPRWPYPSNRSPRPTSPRPVLQDLQARRDDRASSPDCRWFGGTAAPPGMPRRPLTARLASPRSGRQSPMLSPRRSMAESVVCSPREALTVSNELVSRLRRCASEQHVEAADSQLLSPDRSSPNRSKIRSAREQKLAQNFRNPAYRNAAKSATSLAKRTKPFQRWQ